MFLYLFCIITYRKKTFEIMEDLKLIELLRTFDKKEFRKFGEFVKSPYYNKNASVIALFEAISFYYPEFENRNFTLEKIYAKTFRKEKFNYPKITNVISDLYQLAEKYIIQITIEKKTSVNDMALITGLRQKEIGKLYEQKFSRKLDELKNTGVKDENYFYSMYEMYDDYLWYATSVKPNTELNVVQKEFDNFFYYALIRLIRFYSLMLHERNQNNVNYSMTMLDEVLLLLKKGDLINNPTLMVFINVLLLLYTKDSIYYEELKKLKINYFNELRKDDQYMLFVHMYDFCAHMVNNKCDDSYNKDMLDIYKEMLEKEFMTKDNFFYFNFINVVKVACRVGEFEYAENFINDYKDSIPEDEKENVLSFCYGTIENSKGNYNLALEYFSKSNFQNFLLKVQVKILLLKTYYKLEMYEQALQIIDTFRHFIKSEGNLLPEHAKSYSIFLRLMGELIRANEINRIEEREFRLNKIRKEAEKIPANPFRIKVWLIEELNELT